MHLKMVCILLLWDRMFYKQQWTGLKASVSGLIFHLDDLSIDVS